MKKKDILKEPTMKLALINQLLNSDYFAEYVAQPTLSKIILTRYNKQEIKRQNEATIESLGGSYFGGCEGLS